MAGDPATLLVVGDLHGWWNRRDVDYLVGGEQSQVLFVGDFGDEDVDIVRTIASLDAPKSVILGNHDAWASFRHKEPTDAVREMLDILGRDHIAYEVRDVPAAEISIVGARPFSWGGRDLRSPEVYGDLFGVYTSEDSADAIVDAADQAQFDDLIVLGHNGPYGISRQSSSIWGKDFGKRPGGDWGDRDLQDALPRIEARGRRVRAVVAGHMHDRLHPQIGGDRRRFATRDGTAFVNAAVVPRVRQDAEYGECRHYVRITVDRGVIDAIEEIWVDRDGVVRNCDVPEFAVFEQR